MPARSQETPAALEARHGDKMIEVKLRFWTNNLADEPGKVIPKHAWEGGVVRIERNDSQESYRAIRFPFIPYSMSAPSSSAFLPNIK